jgi:hypothetical protein
MVLAVLSDLDPYGLEPGSMAPADEYAPEAAPLAYALRKRGVITAAEVDAIWVRWFGEPLSEVLTPKDFDRFLDEVVALDI